MRMQTLPLVLLVLAIQAGHAAPRFRPFPHDPFTSARSGVSGNIVDKPVAAKLRELEIRPGGTCSDSVFVRRVYLDVIGSLPTADEAASFIRDRSPQKRRVMIDALLERDEFADYWALKWCDLLRVKSEFPINLWPNAVQAYHRWIRSCIKENVPYDRLVREVLISSGSNFRVPQVNFYRAVQGNEPETIARAVALTFMGTRAETWPEERLSSLAAFFSGITYKKTSEWKEEIVYVDLFDTSSEALAARSGAGVLPDGQRVALAPDQDARRVFADWLVTPDNPWFTRHIVNRIWYWLFGRGIIHPPDDIRPDNAPVNPELLSLLESELVHAQYDLKHIYRLILNSATYQRSSVTATEDATAGAHFAHYPLRRLGAEVLVDAICQVTGTTEDYWSVIPEPFTIIPQDQRAVVLADGSITSTFLELFGRPPRDTGLASERNNNPTAAQALHLLNSEHIRRKLERPRGMWSPGRRRGPLAAVTDLYLTVLSRFPTREELSVVRDYTESAEAQGHQVMIDLKWALINSSEFLYRH